MAGSVAHHVAHSGDDGVRSIDGHEGGGVGDLVELRVGKRGGQSPAEFDGEVLVAGAPYEPDGSREAAQPGGGVDQLGALHGAGEAGDVATDIRAVENRLNPAAGQAGRQRGLSRGRKPSGEWRTARSRVCCARSHTAAR
jgi:hypothetical protein